MRFTQFIKTWSNNEIFQGKIMIGNGILWTLVSVVIYRSDNELLNGVLIPLFMELLILLVHGGYILYSRPRYTNKTLKLYQDSPDKAIELVSLKHRKIITIGRLLLKIYQMVSIICVIAAFHTTTLYYKGFALGMLLVFTSALTIEFGFISRSSTFLKFLNKNSFQNAGEN